MPPVCQDSTPRFDYVTHKSDKAFGGNIRYMTKPDATEALWFENLNSRNDNSLLIRLASTNALFAAADIHFINLNVPIKQVPTRTNHGSTHLVQPRPCRLVTPEAKNTHKSQGTAAKFLTRNIPHGLEPDAQRFAGTFENSACCYRGLPLTCCASEQISCGRPVLPATTGGTYKAVGPSQTRKVSCASCLSAEPGVEFLHGAWIVLAAHGMLGVRCHSDTIHQRE